MQIPIQIRQQGGTILGMLHIPTHRPKKSPIVLVNYGLNGDRVDNHRLSILFSKKANEVGITVLRFDYLGCGLSSGDFWNTSLATKAADTIEMIKFLNGCFPEEKFKLVLLGNSDGIRVIHHVLKSQEKVWAICAWNPIIRSMTQTFKSQKEKMAIEPSTKKLVFPVFGVYMGVPYLKETNKDMLIEEVLDFPLPKLFVFGTGDVHTLQFQKELKLLHDERADFDLLEIIGANHLFNRVTWSTELVDKTVNWIEKVCC